MLIFESVLAALVIMNFVLFAMKTHRGLMYWLGLLCACLEAGQRQFAYSLVLAVKHFTSEYPQTLRRVRDEIAERV